MWSKVLRIYNYPCRAATLALRMLMGLAGTANELRMICFLNFCLILLCVIRSRLTISGDDVSIFHTTIFPSFVRESIYVKINDLIVVAIWILVPVLCTRSIVGQWGFFSLTSLGQLFFDAFFTGKVNLLKVVPIITFLLTGASGVYMVKVIYFIYNEWTDTFNPLVQALQLYPAVTITCQTLYQGIFLLHAFGNEEFLYAALRCDYCACFKQLQSHILLNITLLVHCFSILAVVGSKYFDLDQTLLGDHDLIIELAIGEIVYRLFAVVAFCFLVREAQCFEREKSFPTCTSAIPVRKPQFSQPIIESSPADSKFSELVL